jgi:hypothetical protein
MDVHGIELEARLGGAYFFVILFRISVKVWVGHCRDMSDFRPSRRLATQASTFIQTSRFIPCTEVQR